MNAKQIGYFKVGLVVVLAIVFAGVVANSVMTIRRASPPPAPSPRQAMAAAPKPAEPAAAIAEAAPGANETSKAEESKRVWPKFELAEVIAYDPFAIAKPPDAVAALKSGSLTSADGKETIATSTDGAAAAKSEPESSFTGRIHAVYQRGGKTAALVGSKTVRAGDNLDGAGRVVEVDQNGLMLEVNK
jgi:hypothetical protein